MLLDKGQIRAREPRPWIDPEVLAVAFQAEATIVQIIDELMYFAHHHHHTSL